MIFGNNITEVKWRAKQNESLDCIPTYLELDESGILSLKCEDGSVKWTPEDFLRIEYQEIGESPTDETCNFMYSSENQDFESKSNLGLKCLQEKSGKFIYGYGARSISLNDFKCGSRNESDLLCFEKGLSRV